MKETLISKATLGRLPLYLEHLKALPDSESKNISATTIAKGLGLGEVQVRKDLGSVVGTGKPKVGYVITDLIKKLEKVLGFNNKKSAVIVGAGKLGRALLDYEGFGAYGLEIVAAFDNAMERCGTSMSNKSIYPVEQFASFCMDNNVKIGIIAVPQSAAQKVCDMMVKSNITAIWNFSPVGLEVPDNVILQQENLALSLAHLKMQMPENN